MQKYKKFASTKINKLDNYEVDIINQDKNEDDYINLIKSEFNSLDFVVVEKLMCYYINKLNKEYKM